MSGFAQGENMHWIDAVNKSSVRVAFRNSRDGKRTFFRYPDGDCSVVNQKQSSRDASPGECEGFTDWEPFEYDGNISKIADLVTESYEQIASLFEVPVKLLESAPPSASALEDSYHRFLESKLCAEKCLEPSGMDFEVKTSSWPETLLVRIFGRRVYYKDSDGEVWGAWFRGKLYLLKTIPVPEKSN